MKLTDIVRPLLGLGTRQINTTAPLVGGGDLSEDRTLSIPEADATHDGYLSSVRWITFDGYGALIETNANGIIALTGGLADLVTDVGVINSGLSSVVSTVGTLGGSVTSLTGALAANVSATTDNTNDIALRLVISLNLSDLDDVAIARTNLEVYSQAEVDSAIAAAVSGAGTGDMLGANNLSELTDLGIARTTLGLVIGTHVQAYNANLDGWAALAPAAKQDASANLDAWAALATAAKQDALGFTPLNPANNLSEVDPALARVELDVYSTSETDTAIGAAVAAAGGGDMLAANNLSELTDINAAQVKLDVYPIGTVDTALAAKLPKAGGTMTGDLNMGGLRLFTDKVTQSQSAITYGATTNIDFDALSLQTLSLTGSVTFTTSNRAAGRTKRIKILNDASTRNFTFPAGWIFVGIPTAPVSILANKTAYLDLVCFGTTDTSIVAMYVLETAVIGNLLAANNLSELANMTTAATNLGVYKITNYFSEVANQSLAQTNLGVLSKNDSDSGDQKRAPHGGLWFDGTSAGKITGTTGLNLGLMDFSIAIVMEPTVIFTGVQQLFETHSAGSNRVRVQMTGNNQILVLITNNSAVETTYTLSAFTSMAVGTIWTIVISAFRSGSVYGTINGVAAGNTGISAQSAVNIGSGNANPWTIGGSNCFCTIYQVHAWTRALTPAETLLYTRKNLPEPSDQFAVVTPVYTSNFSAGLDGFSASAGLTTLAGNIDSILSHNDTLQLVNDTSNGNHYATKTGVLIIGQRYKVDLVYYIPSSQNANGVSIAGGTLGVSSAAGQVYFAATGAWATVSGEFVATGTSLMIAMMSGSAVSFTGVAANTCYIGSLILTKIGVVFNPDMEQADPALNLAVREQVLGNDGVMAAGIAQISRRRASAIIMDTITAATTWYVRTDGNDNNSGLANTAAGAFLTINKALKTAATRIINATLTIQVADGTYNETVIATGYIGTGALIVTGDAANQDAVIVNSTSYCFNADGGAVKIYFRYMKATGTIGGFKVSRNAIMILTAVTSAACSEAHFRAETGGMIEMNGTNKVTGSAVYCMWTVNNGTINSLLASLDCSAAQTYSGAFAYAIDRSFIYALSMTITNGGNVTSTTRYISNNLSLIDTGAGGANYFPGGVAGTTAGSGVYL